MRLPVELQILIVLFSLLATLSVPAAPPPGGTRIATKAESNPSPLAELAAQLVSARQDQQWEFAAIALDVLLETYERELEAASREKASTRARRAKLARWQRATRGLVAQLHSSRLKLAEGAAFSLYVDPRGQILIVVDGQTVVVSGPRGMNDDEIAASILDQYCAYNDCSILVSDPGPVEARRPEASGTWLLSQQMRPRYQLGDDLVCEFDSIENRRRKAQVCEQLAAELDQLARALQQTINQGHPIDWQHMMQSPPKKTRPYIVLNGKGDFLELPLKLLNRVEGDGWQDMLEWLRRGIDGTPRQLVILRADRFNDN